MLPLPAQTYLLILVGLVTRDQLEVLLGAGKVTWRSRGGLGQRCIEVLPGVAGWRVAGLAGGRVNGLVIGGVAFGFVVDHDFQR